MPNHQRLHQDIEGVEADLDRLRKTYRHDFEQISARDPAYAAAQASPLDAEQMRQVLARLTGTQSDLLQQPSGSAWLILLELPGHGKDGGIDAKGKQRIAAMWLGQNDDRPRLIELPDLWALAQEHEAENAQSMTVEIYGPSLRKGDLQETELPDTEPEQLAKPGQSQQRNSLDFLDRLQQAIVEPLKQAGIDLQGFHSLVLCSHGSAHALPFASLPIFRLRQEDQTGQQDGGDAVSAPIRLLHYPGLPYALGAAQRMAEPAEPASRWLLASEAALDTRYPLPMTLVEREMARQIIGRTDPDRVQIAHSSEQVRQRFGPAKTEPSEQGDQGTLRPRMQGFMALCHGQHSQVHDSQLYLGGEPLRALDVLGWSQAPRLALLPVCLVGRARDDDRGNAMGLVSALMLRGAEVVIGYTRPVADALSPWMSSLILWHMANGLDACSAAHRARGQFERQHWPQKYQEQMRECIDAVVPLLLWGRGKRGALVDEVIPSNANPDDYDRIKKNLQGMAQFWPWVGREALAQLLDNPADEPEQRLKAVCEGLFDPHPRIKDKLGQAMAEQARSLQVFGA